MDELFEQENPDTQAPLSSQLDETEPHTEYQSDAIATFEGHK